jgi:hypothetical protein
MLRAMSEFLEVNLNYAPRPAAKPSLYAYVSREDEAAPEGPDRRRVVVHDGRGDADMQLDVSGCALVPLATRATDLWDAAQIRSIYYAEVEALVARVTGATRVLAFDHNLRSAPRLKAREPGVQGPVKYAHNDYTERSGPQRVRDLLPDEAEDLLAHRFAVINVWKPIRGPVLDVPLGVCDARTIGDGDLVPSDLRYRDRTGEIYGLGFAPEHRWIFFPRMQADEAMLLKCYDSVRDGRARFTAHSAFRDPTAPPDAPPRESIEVRTLAFFCEEAHQTT